ncbi:MAG TPA: hypothetical protein VKA21_15005 [Candidatus Binatia bacterium]|nr:hypothetical protein [Candidatus Binatia bacterium]
MSPSTTVVLGALLVAAAGAADGVRTEHVGLRFTVPAPWTRVPAPSDVRAGQWRIPGADGTGDGELVLFFFGRGKGGGVDDNLERWYGQVEQPDKRPSREAAVVTTRTVNGLRVTSVDVAGTYRGMGIGGPAEPKPGSRLLAAVVEGADGPWFFRAVGPAATIAAAKGSFDGLLASLEAHR